MEKYLVDAASRADFRKLLEYYKIKLEKDRWITCPFHQGDRSPSLNFDFQRNIWNCFGCGSKGNIISFVQQLEKLSFENAVMRLQPFAPKTMQSTVKTVAPEVALVDCVKQTQDKIDELFFKGRQLLSETWPVATRTDEEYWLANAAFEEIMFVSDQVMNTLILQKDLFKLKKQLTDWYFSVVIAMRTLQNSLKNSG